MKHKRILLAATAAALSAGPALAQALPRIAALYPPGAKAGATTEVAIRGGGLVGAKEVIVAGDGITARLNALDVKIDPADQKAFQAKCALCHDLRGPATISRTADQWVATVDRMIKDRGAPIDAADRTKIVNYVQAAARSAAGLTAQITVAPNAAPGVRELRVVGAGGTSTAFPFEVTTQPDALEVEPNNEVPKAPVVSLPITVSGQLAQSDVDCFAFQAKKGQRLVFNCNAYRLNAASQAFFYPVLSLYDDKGRELAKNNGYFSLDPLIDWTAPDDGKYVVLLRDMLYRGSPASVYRLSIGELPYKTYLFPPGGKRGGATAVTVSGENMQPATLNVPLAANAPLGVRQISTPSGPFPFVTGDYEEFIEPKERGAHPITLPLSINGRISAPGEVDKYTFTLEKEQLGNYSFELFGDRVGSPLVARLNLRNEKGQSLVNNNGGTGGNRDPRLDYNFTQPGTYTLEVSDAAEKGGISHVYRVSAGAANPDFQVTVTPDNPNLGPGSSVYVMVKVLRRVGITSPIEVTFPNLPPGVTASPVLIQPNETDGFTTLNAAKEAKPGTFALVEAVAKAQVGTTMVERECQPYEIYRINNNAQISYRSNMVVSVGPEAEWTVSLSPSELKLSPDSPPVQVRATLNRVTGDRDLPFAIVGIPNGVQAPRSLLFKKGVSELTFELRPSNQGIFAPRSANQPPPPKFFNIAVVNGREGEGMMMCSPALPVRLELSPTTASAK